MYSRKPEANELHMDVCKDIVRDKPGKSKEILDIAYKKANNLINMRDDIKSNNCTIVPDTLIFEPRARTASIKVYCETPLKGKTFKGGGLYFSVFHQDANNIEINDEDSLYPQ